LCADAFQTEQVVSGEASANEYETNRRHDGSEFDVDAGAGRRGRATDHTATGTTTTPRNASSGTVSEPGGMGRE
jgi:hypothetical protein